MTNMATYTLRDYVKNLSDVAEKAGGRSDWRSWLRTKAQQAELDEQWVDLKIAQSLEPAELDDPTLLRRREKMRIATAASCDVSRINKFMVRMHAAVAELFAGFQTACRLYFICRRISNSRSRYTVGFKVVRHADLLFQRLSKTTLLLCHPTGTELRKTPWRRAWDEFEVVPPWLLEETNQRSTLLRFMLSPC